MRVLKLSVIILMLFSCENDNRLCECVEVGSRVNELSASFFDGQFPQSRQDSLKAAKKQRDSICKPFVNMMPEELHEAAKDCESLLIDNELK